MCRMASFFHRPDNGDVVVHDLTAHGETEKALKLNVKLWCEGHYAPDGEVEARVPEGSGVTAAECAERIKTRWPRFVDFFNWALEQTGQTKEYKGYLDLRGLTSAEREKVLAGWKNKAR